MEMTVKPIWRDADEGGLVGGDSPRSWWRWMFSIMTMASSTTKPTEMVRAMREKLLRLRSPCRYMAARVPERLRGTVTAAREGWGRGGA